jgi:VanZ family protein
MDKVAHAGLYAILGAALGYGRHHSIPSPAHLTVISVGALYGATDEWHQAFVPRRSPDLGDWVADVFGVVVGYTVAVVVLGWLARRRKPSEKGVHGS